MPLQVQDSDNTKLEVHGLFKKRLKHSDKTRREVHQSHCRCKKMMNLSRRCTSVSVSAQSNESTKSKVFDSVETKFKIKISY